VCRFLVQAALLLKLATTKKIAASHSTSRLYVFLFWDYFVKHFFFVLTPLSLPFLQAVLLLKSASFKKIAAFEAAKPPTGENHHHTELNFEKRSTGHTHTHTDREQHPRQRHTHTHTT